MRASELRLSLSPDPRVPLYRRLAAALAEAIRDGRLEPGAPLPGSRQLADLAGANRKTVVEALKELEAEGWVITEPSRGTFVAGAPPRPEGGVALESRAQGMGFDLPVPLDPLSAQMPGTVYLADGFPDPRLAPAEALAKAYQRALRRHGGQLLDRGAPEGVPLLREVLAGWLGPRVGRALSPGEVLVTRGGTAALSLLGRALLAPGEVVAVEEPGNRAAWEALAQRGDIQLLPVPVDEWGLDPETLAERLTRQPIRMLYLTPRCQYPTMVPLSPERRARVLALSRQHRFAVVEDDGDAVHVLEEPGCLPLVGEDDGGQVIHVSCFSRLLAPGIRLGCLVAPEPLVARLARLQRGLEWQGDAVLEWALADLIRDGDLDRTLRKTRHVIRQRMACLADGLEQSMGDLLAFRRPASGLSLWVVPRSGAAPGPWQEAARQRGVLLHAPRHHWLEGRGSGIRLGFAQHDSAVLAEALSQLQVAWNS